MTLFNLRYPLLTCGLLFLWLVIHTVLATAQSEQLGASTASSNWQTSSLAQMLPTQGELLITPESTVYDAILAHPALSLIANHITLLPFLSSVKQILNGTLNTPQTFQSTRPSSSTQSGFQVQQGITTSNSDVDNTTSTSALPSQAKAGASSCNVTAVLPTSSVLMVKQKKIFDKVCSDRQGNTHLSL